jgi:hypothetical protein
MSGDFHGKVEDMATVAEDLWQVAQRVCDLLNTSAAETAASTSVLPVVDRLDDDSLMSLMTATATLRARADAIMSAAAGVVAKRSDRASGYSGLAQREGHRSPVAMVQSLTGATRIEAARHVRFGEAMREARDASAADGDAINGDVGMSPSRDPATGDEPWPWFQAITAAVDAHLISPEAAAAILKGLGDPDEHCTPAMLREAATGLLADAARVNVDDLARQARWARDRLTPEAITIRVEERFQARAWRFGRNASGARTAWVTFDDESADWIETVVDAAMRPRRGGPRFVDKDERERAQQLIDDPRSNDQLVYDLLVDTLHAGVDADPTRVLGTRQAGVRYVITQEAATRRDDDGNLTGIGHLEDTGEAVPGSVIERQLCLSGHVPVIVDECGCPLDVGREQRTFTPKQRVALAVRDGGCLWPGCDQKASYTEAHHINEWWADHGRTDIKDGVLLCRFHHMLLHNNHWRITRSGTDYWLIPPTAIDPTRAPIRLRHKTPLAYARTG